MKLKLTLLLIISSLALYAQDFASEWFSSETFIDQMAIGDFDGDGHNDFIGIDQRFNNPSDIYLFKNKGEGAITFDETLLNEGYDTDSEPIVLDFDQDGDLDFIIGKGEFRDLMLFSNNGDATFEESLLVTEAGNINKVIDADNDGDLDIFSLDTEFGFLTYFQNRGADGFFFDQLRTGDTKMVSYDIGDVDQDGKIDVVLGFDTFIGRKISIFHQANTFGFTEEVLVEDDFESLYQVAVVDIDEDGQLDIVASNDEEIAAWLHQGDFNFEKATLAENTNGGPFGFISFELADINGDNHLDIFTASGDDGIHWLENTNLGPLSFESQAISGVRPAFSLASGDLDGDQDIDFLVSNGDLWWFQNNVEQVTTSIISIQQTKIKIFPNPFTDYLQIEGIESDSYQLELIDMTGRTVVSKKINKKTIALPNLPTGKYQINLRHLTTKTIIGSAVMKVE